MFKLSKIVMINTFLCTDVPEMTTIEFTLGGEVAFVLSCSSQKSSPTQVLWRKNGKLLSLSDTLSGYKMSQVLVDRVTSAYISTLTMDGVLDDVVGEYSCTVVNSLGTSNTLNTTIERKFSQLNSSTSYRKFWSIANLNTVPLL